MRVGNLRVLVANAQQSWPDGRVACVWLPQLPLRVEVLRHPAWDGYPLVLGGAPGERKVVQLCSPEAERAGIRPGMPLREVLALCRYAIVVQPDPVRIAAVMDDLVEALQHVVPAVEPAEDGDLYLDLRGLEKLYEHDFARLEQTIHDAVPPLLRPRLGVGRGKFVACVAARAAAAEGRPTYVVPARSSASFLGPLAITHLPFDPDDQQRLALFGLRTIGELARLPFTAVQAQFGPIGARAWQLAHGREDDPVRPSQQVRPVRASLRFDDPLASVDAIMVCLDQLLSETFAQPALYGRSVRQARLRALLADGSSWERLYTFKEALSDRESARRALRARLDLPEGLPPAPVEEFMLELLGLAGEAAKQAGLFSLRARQMGPITEAVRQLHARYGRNPLYNAVEVEPWSRIPERRWALVTCDL